jgi:hypothetical protein
MNRRTAQLLDRVAATRPVPPHASHQVAGESTRGVMLERILATPERDTGPARRRLPVRRGLPFALAAVTFVVVAALAIGLMPGRGPGGAAPASALELAARAAAAQPHRVPSPDERWYQRVVHDESTSKGTEREVIETWVDRDGAVWIRTRVDGPELHQVLPLARTTWSRLVPTSSLPFAEISNLPTEPGALRARLAATTVKWPDGTLIPDPVPMAALGLLGHPGLRPAQRAALFRILAKASDVTATGHTKDPRGRPAVSIDVIEARDRNVPGGGPGYHVRFLFAEDTSALICFQTLANGGNVTGPVKGRPLDTVLYDDWKVVPAPKG